MDWFQPTWRSMAAIVMGAFLIGLLSEATCYPQTGTAVSGEQP